MRRILPLFSLLLLCSCGLFSHHTEETPSVIERAIESGKANIEIEPVATFDRADLPAGIEAKDVLRIFTLKDDPIQAPSVTSGGDAVSTPEPVAVKPAKTPKASREIIVLKNGTVLAGKEAASQLENVETPKPSYAWAWWTLLVVLVLVAAGWGVKQLATVFEPAAKIVSLVTEIFKK